MVQDENGKYTQVAVVSYVPNGGCIDDYLPPVFARISHELDWLLPFISDADMCLSPARKLELDSYINKKSFI